MVYDFVIAEFQRGSENESIKLCETKFLKLSAMWDFISPAPAMYHKRRVLYITPKIHLERDPIVKSSLEAENVSESSRVCWG